MDLTIRGILYKILPIFLYCSSFLVHGFTDDHPDTYLTITELAKKYGYPMENYDVTTEDGYILKMFRIPHGKNGSGINSRPILLMHGLFGQAENFIVNGMLNGSLAYFMADNGYDVWLGNSRGTAHSRKHVRLNPDFPQFWNFSWHEIGLFDMPAKIDFILSKTNKKRILYVGHSQGGTTLLVLTAERSEYQKKIIAASLLSPAFYMSHTSSAVYRFFAVKERQDFLMESAERNGQYEFPDQKNSFKNIFNSMCLKTHIFDDLCLELAAIFNGGSLDNINQKIFPLLFQCIPTISIRQMVHFFQEVGSGHFRKWDFGTREKNMEIYGQAEPPDYPLQKILIPIEMYSSLGDELVDYKDVRDSCTQLPNCLSNDVISIPKWSHIDFLFSSNAREMINQPILRFMNKYQNNENPL